MSEVSRVELRRLHLALQRADGWLLDATVPATADRSLRQLYTAVVDGLISISHLQELLGDGSDQDGEDTDE